MPKDKFPQVTKHCEENPNMMTRTLARMIYGQDPELYQDIEHVRRLIRTRRGNSGKLQRKKVKGRFGHLFSNKEDRNQNYFLEPEDPPDLEYHIPTSIKNTLVISDLHIPYHELEAVYTALDSGIKHGVDSIIINGDLIDFYKISRYTKDPTKKNIRYEFEMTQEFFDFLREKFPKQQIYFKLGNHEERYEDFLKSKAPELFGDPYYSLEERLGLNQWGIHYIGGRQVIKYGKLNIVHGHEFGSSFFSPVNPARGLFLRAKASTMAGHNHQTSEHHENNLNGDQIACWSLGCLCNKSPEYRPFAYTKWNWGFAIVEKDKKGRFQVENKRIML